MMLGVVWDVSALAKEESQHRAHPAVRQGSFRSLPFREELLPLVQCFTTRRVGY